MADPRDQHEEEQAEDVAAKAEEDKAKAKKAAAEEKPKAKPRARKKKEDATPADDDSAAEDKPKPKRTRKKKADEETAADEAPKTKAKRPARSSQLAESKDEEEPSADEVAEKAKTDEVDKPKRRARGAEATAGRKRQPTRKRAASADGDAKVVVRAKARYVRTAPRKARLVVDHIRGKSVDEARAILIHTPRAASRDVLKLLDSAIANAENNHELVADELKIDRVFVDEGPTLKRYRPRALGRATQIRKRTSHMTILLTPKE
jgi:ribosomal protein L22